MTRITSDRVDVGDRREVTRRLGRREMTSPGAKQVMINRITRRDALKIGTNAAVSAAVAPLLVSGEPHPANRASPRSDSEPGLEPGPMPASGDDLCLLRAVDMLALLRQKKLSARELMDAHLRQVAR